MRWVRVLRTGSDPEGCSDGVCTGATGALATNAGDTAGAPESMVMDAEPAEGGEAAPVPEESLAESEREMLKVQPLTQQEALDRLEEHLSLRGLSLVLTPEPLSSDGSFWVFLAENPDTGERFRFSVSCTNGSVEETPLS